VESEWTRSPAGIRCRRRRRSVEKMSLEQAKQWYAGQWLAFLVSEESPTGERWGQLLAHHPDRRELHRELRDKESRAGLHPLRQPGGEARIRGDLRMRARLDIPFVLRRVEIHGPAGVRKMDVILDTCAVYTVIAWDVAKDIGYDPAISRGRPPIITAKGVIEAPRGHPVGRSGGRKTGRRMEELRVQCVEITSSTSCSRNDTWWKEEDVSLKIIAGGLLKELYVVRISGWTLEKYLKEAGARAPLLT